MAKSRRRRLRRERYLILPGIWVNCSPTRFRTAADMRNGRRSRPWPGNDSRRRLRKLAAILTASSLPRQVSGWGKVSHRRGGYQVVVVPSCPTEDLFREERRNDYQRNWGVS